MCARRKKNDKTINQLNFNKDRVKNMKKYWICYSISTCLSATLFTMLTKSIQFPETSVVSKNVVLHQCNKFGFNCNKTKLIQSSDTWTYRLNFIDPFLVKSMHTCTAILSFITIFTYAFSITITSLILRTNLVTTAYYKVEKVNQKLNFTSVFTIQSL